MPNTSLSTQKQLAAENEDLRARLSEAVEALQAIRGGKVDALTVPGVHGEQLFTLKGAERPYRILIEQMNEGALTLTAKGVIVYANQRFAEMLKSPLDTVIGSDFHSWIAPAYRQQLESLLGRQAGEKRREELALTASDGAFVPVYLSVNGLLPADETLASFCLVATDLTEQKHIEEIVVAEKAAQELLAASNRSRQVLLSVIEDQKRSKQALLESEREFHSLAEAMPQMVWMTRPDGWNIYFNHRWVEYTGQTLEESYGHGWNKPFHPDDRQRAWDAWQDATHNAATYSLECRLRRADGVYHWWLVRGVPTKDTHGNIIKWFGTCTDINELKQSEEALRESEERYRRLVEVVPEGIIVHSEGRVVFANPASARIIGAASTAELIGKSVIEFVHPEDRELALARINRSLIEATPATAAEEKFIRIDGTSIDVSVAAIPFTYAGKRAMLTVFNDITDRKRVAGALEESEQQYRQFFEDDLTGDYESTPDGTVIKCNSAFARMFGFASVAEALQSSARTLYTDSKSREVFLRLLNENKKLEYHETELFRRDGTPVYCVQNAIGIFDGQGKLERVRGYLFDDSRRKTLEQQLLQAQKLESLGTLASGIAHDFNNILGIILAHSSLLESLPENPALVTKNSASIARAVQRGSDLVKQMLTFARKADVLVVPVPLNDIIQEVVKLLAETLPKSIEVILHLKKSLPSIEADVTQIHQVLINLCVNARDAMPDGGVLTISSRLVPLKDVEFVPKDTSAQEFVELSVSDTGTGMDEATQQRIFEPFFTTKVRGQGTGLGLSLVYGIMESHKGVVTIRSAPDKGSTFHCYFPVPSTAPGIALDEVLPPAELQGGNETILFVEDEESLRAPITDFLALNGYTVLVAGDGEEALAIFRQKGEVIRLIISDLDLPKISGDALFRKVRQVNDRISFILASGFFESGLKAQMFKEGVHIFLQKPYNSAEVLRSIRKAIDKGG